MLITRGAAHYCPADAVTAWGPQRLGGRGDKILPELQLSPRARRHCAPAAPNQPPRVYPMSFVRSRCGLGLRATPHR